MLRKLITACCVIAMLCPPAMASTLLKNICRIKGQEPIELQGLGVVVGLNGTGESNDPATMRAIARAMQIFGNPPGMDGKQNALDEFRKMKNTALVIVSAKIPPTGARRGELLDCYVSALNGKSLDGGRLLSAALQGPRVKDPTVYANCSGQVLIDNDEQPMVARVHNGCQMNMDVYTPFTKDGCITLVLDEYHANFQTSAIIATEIQRKFGEYEGGGEKQKTSMAHAVDATNIVVRIPQSYVDDPVDFASIILDARIDEYEPEARVVINSRAGTIVISGDVEIGDVIVSHKNVTVETDGTPGDTFSQLDIDGSNQPRLKQLVDQLNALKVPTDDMIEIIQGIERLGKLHGKLIIE